MRSMASLLAALAVLTGCAGYSLDFLANYEPGQDYTKYRTFNFYDKPGEGRFADHPELDQRLRESVEAGLVEAGYTKADHPDFWVNYWLDVEGRQHANRPSGYQGDTREVVGTEEFQSGTLVLDFVDAGNSTRYWRGAAIGDLAERTPKDRLEKAVALILENYPPQD